MPAKSDPREGLAEDRYYYPRPLSARELLPALGAGLVAGAAVFYVASILLRREPLRAPDTPGAPGAGRGPRTRPPG